MSADQYLFAILNRESVDTGVNSPVRSVQSVLMPALSQWAGNFLHSVGPSGSFAKGTANSSGTDIDLFISLSEQTTNTLKEIYESLLSHMQANGYAPKRQNVSINIRVNGYDVDLVPGKRQDSFSHDHSLYQRRNDTWTKTNVLKHINYVISGNRLLESRVLKLWRSQKRLEFPSFYLELSAINALSGQHGGTLSINVLKVFHYLRDIFASARVVDPANTNNVISDDLSAVEKIKVKDEAVRALSASTWNQIIR